MAIQLIKRKSGNIYRAVFCKNRKRITHCFDRKWNAEMWLKQQEELNRFGYKKQITFSEAANIWSENHSKVRKAPSSYISDEKIVKSLKLEFGENRLDEIAPEMIERFISKKLQSGIKPATMNRYLQCFRAILNYFIKKRYLMVNVVAIVGLLPVGETPYDYLSLEEADRFLTYTNQKYASKNRWVYRLYLLAINTGMRWGEIAGLKWDKVDFHQKSIVVARSYCRFSKQIRETTKGKKIRYVGANSSLLPELKAQFEESEKAQNLVFSLNQKVIDLDNFKRDHFEKDLKEAGNRLIRFHDLRHTFASHFMMKNGNLYDLQKLMGHSEIKTTERYAHLSPQSLVSRTELIAIDGGKKSIIPLEISQQKTA